MKRSISNRTKMILLMLIASATVTMAQGLFKIVEGLSDNNLKTTMEANVNAMMMAMNTAVSENAKTVNRENKNQLEAHYEISLKYKDIWMYNFIKLESFHSCKEFSLC